MASSPFVRVMPTDAPAVSLRAFQRPVGTAFLVHSGFAASAWALGLATDRMDYKDMAWAAGPVANAWYQAVGIPVLRYGLPVQTAIQGLTWRQGLLLGGTTAWGLRLFFQVSSTSTKRGRDDERYNKNKTEPSFWSKASVSTYVPEAIFQTLITLPVSAALRQSRVELVPWGWTDLLAVGVFSAGLALEVLADSQKKAAKKAGVRGIYRGGVWSLVRHPNYLGDALTHLSFALLAWNTPSTHPALFLGPIANYVFLRFVGGDAQLEADQSERYNEFDPAKERQFKRYQTEVNAFWPRLSALTEPWAFAIVALGAAGVGLEKIVRVVVKPNVL